MKFVEAKHGVFRRAGVDLHTEITISLREALLGFERNWEKGEMFVVFGVFVGCLVSCFCCLSFVASCFLTLFDSFCVFCCCCDL